MKRLTDKTAARLLAVGMAPTNTRYREQARATGFTATLYLLLLAGLVVLGMWFRGL